MPQPEQSSETRTELHTFLFADLAGYSALTEVHGDHEAADVAARFFAAVRPLLPEYGMEEVKAIGDALLLRADDAAAALHVAARMVSDFGSTHGSLGVRVGIHTGTAVQRDGDWFGSAVNVAARVAEAATAGEVLLTESTASAVSGAVLSAQLRPRGHRSLKNIRDPVELFALTLDEAASPLPTDPVCLMTVDAAEGFGPAEWEGVSYHFCSQSCLHAFEADPARYVQRRKTRDEWLVSDEARERAARTVGRAYAKGRLTPQELEERAERAYAARTRGDLRAATSGLPRRRRRVPWLLRPFVWLFFLVPARLTRRARRLRAARHRGELRP